MLVVVGIENPCQSTGIIITDSRILSENVEDRRDTPHCRSRRLNADRIDTLFLESESGKSRIHKAVLDLRLSEKLYYPYPSY